MPNYKNSKIYKIVDNTNNNIYIGSTTEKYLSRRLNKHLDNYKRFLEGKVKTSCSCKIIFENNNFYIQLIENYPCDDINQLTSREQFYINQNNCININRSYVSRETSKKEKCLYSKKYYNDNKEEVKKVNKKYREKNKENITDWFKLHYEYKKSWGEISGNNLLRIDVNLFL